MSFDLGGNGSDRAVKILRRSDGRLVLIGLMGGAKAEIGLATLLTRRLSLMGSTLRTRPVEEKAAIVAGFQARFGAALAEGRIRPIVDRVLPLAADATPLLLGQAQGIEPAQPLAWTRRYGPAKARVFYTSLGAPEDVTQPAVRRLITNAVQWTLGEAG